MATKMREKTPGPVHFRPEYKGEKHTYEIQRIEANIRKIRAKYKGSACLTMALQSDQSAFSLNCKQPICSHWQWSHFMMSKQELTVWARFMEMANERNI